jgi:3D (Asp-Asp-Asp) domain-containing protein
MFMKAKFMKTTFMKAMCKKTIVAGALILILMAGRATGKASAQDSSPAKVAPEAEKTVNSYRLDFAVNEFEDGKKINTRQYSMNLNAEDSNEIKIGTRVPIESKQGEFTYLDVGTSIWCRLGERSNGLPISVRAEISNFAMPDQQTQTVRPVLRQLSIKASTVAQLGKPMVVGSVDDPNSKRQFQLEVTVTKLR